MLHRLLLLLFSLLASFPLAAQDRPRAALAPVGSLDVPTAQQVILFNRLQDRLSTRYDLVSQSDFASAQDEVFTSLTAEECTVENCIRVIQELLQVEDYFHLQLVRFGQDTQLTLTAVDLDKRQVRSDYCKNCDQPELNQRLDTLITSLLPAWRATIKHEQVAIACILQAIATSLTGGVHAFRSSVVVESTVDGLSLHPGGVQRTDVFFRNLLGKSGGHQQCTHQESRRQTDDSFQDESIGGASTA